MTEDKEITGQGAYGVVHFTEAALQIAQDDPNSIDARALKALVDKGKADTIEEAAEFVQNHMASLHTARLERAKAKKAPDPKPARPAKARTKKKTATKTVDNAEGSEDESRGE